MSKPDMTTSTKAGSQPSTPLLTKKKPQMDFFPAKGLGSYHCFGATEEKSKKLFRSAVLQYGSLSTLPNADQALASVLPRGFVEEAAAHGCSLKEAVTEAQAFYLANLPSPKAKRDVIDYDTRRLSGILAALSPNDRPAALLDELKGLIENKGAAVVAHLERMEKEAGRDSEGFIYLRRVAR